MLLGGGLFRLLGTRLGMGLGFFKGRKSVMLRSLRIGFIQKMVGLKTNKLSKLCTVILR